MSAASPDPVEWNVPPNEPRASDPPLLILLSDDPKFSRVVRSHTHTLRVWTSAAATAEHEFAGDPTAPATYDWTRTHRSVTAVIDVSPVDRARATLHALREVRPDAAGLLLTNEARDVDHDEDGTLARGGELRDVLRLDLDEELQRLEAERRRYCLKRFAADAGVVPILIHGNPDPDAVSSAFAVMTIVDGSAERTPIVTLEDILRPENRRMVELLKIQIARVTEAELLHFERVIAVDMQPVGLQREGRPRYAVIDHHPRESGYRAELEDIRPDYGATATMLTEYLRSVTSRRISEPLATALLFGIKTDTDSLSRGVSPADVAAYAFLQRSADAQLVRRFERASYGVHAIRAFGEALAHASYDDGLCCAFVGELAREESYILAELADLCLGVENITWAVAGARVEDNLVLTLRHAGTHGAGAGAVARALAGDAGSGGGHASMARVTIPTQAAHHLMGETEAETVAAIHREASRSIEAMTRASNRPALHRAHQA